MAAVLSSLQAVQTRLGTANELPDDFQQARSLAHRYMGLLQTHEPECRALMEIEHNRLLSETTPGKELAVTNPKSQLRPCR